MCEIQLANAAHVTGSLASDLTRNDLNSLLAPTALVGDSTIILAPQAKQWHYTVVPSIIQSRMAMEVPYKSATSNDAGVWQVLQQTLLQAH